MAAKSLSTMSDDAVSRNSHVDFNSYLKPKSNFDDVDDTDFDICTSSYIDERKLSDFLKPTLMQSSCHLSFNIMHVNCRSINSCFDDILISYIRFVIPSQFL